MAQTRYRAAFEIGNEATPRTLESIRSEFQRLYLIITRLAEQLEAAGGGGGGGTGVLDAQYILGADDGRLPNARTLTDDTDIDWDLATPGDAKAVFADRDALSVLGVAGSAPARPAPIVGATPDTYLKSDGTTLAFAPITPGDITGFDHNLLSAVHPDTVANPPEPGAIVVGYPAAEYDVSTFWLDGLPVPGVPDLLDDGGMQFWLDGLPVSSGETLAGAKWQRLTPTVPQTVPMFDGTTTVWAPLFSVFRGARAVRGSNLTVPASEPIPWSATDFDSGYWNGAAPTRFTVPSGQGGTFLLIGQITWALSAFLTEYRGQWRVNGATVVADTFGEWTSVAMQVTAIVQLVEGDYVELMAAQPSGSDRTVTGSGAATWGGIVRLAS